MVNLNPRMHSTAELDTRPPVSALGVGSPVHDRGPRRPADGSGSVRTLMRVADSRLDLLRARGVPVAPVDLARPYARFLAGAAWALAPAAPSEKGYDAVDRDGIRYRVVGLRCRNGAGRVDIPGVPDRLFDRIVLVRFGVGFDVAGAWRAAVEPFLKSATYDADTNRWALDADASFWTGGSAEDVTREIRREATRLERSGRHAIRGSSSSTRSRSGGGGARTDGAEGAGRVSHGNERPLVAARPPVSPGP